MRKALAIGLVGWAAVAGSAAAQPAPPPPPPAAPAPAAAPPNPPQAVPPPEAAPPPQAAPQAPAQPAPYPPPNGWAPVWTPGPPQPWQPPQPSGPMMGPPFVPAPQVDPDLARLDHILRHHADNGRAYGIATGVAGLLVGAATIPTGVYMLGKNSNDPVPGSILVGVGISSAAAGIISFFVTSGDLDALGRSLEDKEEQGEPSQAIVAEIEHDWREKAESTRATRKAVGIIGIVAGTVLMAVGAGFSIADTLDGLTATEQQTFGVIMMTGGAVNVLGGFGSVFLASPIESTWEIYQSFKGPRAGAPMMAPPPVQPPAFGFAPIQNGAMLFSSMRF